MTAHTAPTGPAAPLVPGDLFARRQIITGLRALADFLEANPAVPVDEYGETFTLFPRTPDDATAAALVDQIAALLGVGVTDDRPTGGHYTAEKSFGHITYRVVHIPDRQQREHLARTSYGNNIVLDPDPHDDDNGDETTGRAA